MVYCSTRLWFIFEISLNKDSMGAGRIQITLNVAGLAWELLISLHNSTLNCRDHPEDVTFYSMLSSKKV